MKINCLIVDDEPLAANVIKKYLTNFTEVEVLNTCQDALEAFSYLSSNRHKTTDLMFLDINMPEISGMELMRRLDTKPLTIITTAYREHAVESYELDVFDYLMKPIAYSRFSKTIEKAIEHFNLMHKVTNSSLLAAEEEYLFIKVDKKMVKVYLADILYIESLKDYVRVVCANQNFITHSNLGNFTAQLSSDKFLRVHRSYTVSLSKIKALEGNTVSIGNKIIPIGRNYQVTTKKLILSHRVEI